MLLKLPTHADHEDRHAHRKRVHCAQGIFFIAYLPWSTGESMLTLTFVAFKKLCQMRHPPGRKVYQRGGHIIWEVDGAKEKVRLLRVCIFRCVTHFLPLQLWCQNLALLGKLFIDHKCESVIGIPIRVMLMPDGRCHLRRARLHYTICCNQC